MQPNQNLQALKLRAIARGLGASLVKDGMHSRYIMQWNQFLTASVYYGTWKRSGRIVFRAHHPNSSHNCPEITVSATRPVKVIVRDVENRFIAHAREFCRASQEQHRKTEARNRDQKLRIQSLLYELGADYKESVEGARHSHLVDFHTHGVSFSQYDVSENRSTCRVTIDCSEHCLRHILRLVRSDYEFRQSVSASFK